MTHQVSCPAVSCDNRPQRAHSQSDCRRNARHANRLQAHLIFIFFRERICVHAARQIARDLLLLGHCFRCRVDGASDAAIPRRINRTQHHDQIVKLQDGAVCRQAEDVARFWIYSPTFRWASKNNIVVRFISEDIVDSLQDRPSGAPR